MVWGQSPPSDWRDGQRPPRDELPLDDGRARGGFDGEAFHELVEVFHRAREQAGHEAVIDIEPIEGDDFRIWMHQRPPTFGPVPTGAARHALIAALAIGEQDLGPGPIEIVSTGHSKVMVPLRSRAVLDRLDPDLSALAALSRDIGCNGYHLFTLADPAPGILAHARMFAPAIGIAEDPVTGNGNGPLGAYLVRHRLVSTVSGQGVFSCTMRQGEAIGRAGEVEVEVTTDPDSTMPSAVRIGGEAVVVFRTELRL